MSELLHASAVQIGQKAALLTGPSGSGKSDLALRLIDRGARLIGDDAVVFEDGLLSGPSHLRGQLEVRGIGIVSVPFCDTKVPLFLHIDLVPRDGVTRMPAPEVGPFGASLLRLHAFDQSTPLKVEAALSGLRAPLQAVNQ